MRQCLMPDDEVAGMAWHGCRTQRVSCDRMQIGSMRHRRDPGVDAAMKARHAGEASATVIDVREVQQSLQPERNGRLQGHVPVKRRTVERVVRRLGRIEAYLVSTAVNGGVAV